MKNKLVTLSVVACALLVSGGIFFYNQNKVKAVGSSPILISQTSASTSSPNYLQTGLGTTTLTFSTGDFTGATILLRYFASSTSNQETSNKAPLFIETQASNDGVDWYTYDSNPILTGSSYGSNASTTSISLASSTVFTTYTPLVANSTSTKAFNLKLQPAQFTRLIFFLSSSTPSTTFKDGGALHVKVIGNRIPY